MLEHGGCSPKEAASEEAPRQGGSPILRECGASVAAGSRAPDSASDPSERAFFGGGGLSTDEHSCVFVILTCDAAAVSQNLQLMSSELFPVNSRPGVTHRRSLSVTVITAFPGNRRSGKKRILPGYMSRTTATQTELCCFLINGLVTGLIMLL